MGTLVLVRHGQALPFEEDGDRLSPLGEAQSRGLREYWARLGVRFDDVLTGSLERQRATAGLACPEGWPAPCVDPRFDEYDAVGIIGKLVPMLSARDAEFCRLWGERRAAAGRPDRNRYFQRMFEAVMSRWQDDSLTAPGVEPWSAFRERVVSAIGGIMENSAGGRRVVVFTSGGVIGCAVAMALRAPAQSAMEVNWRVKNCSLTEFVFSRGRLSLDAFNTVPHLEDPALVTFR